MSSEGKIPIHGFQVDQGPPTQNNAPSNKGEKSHSTHSLSKTTSIGATFPPVSSTPKSKVKVTEAGQEHTGRWTREEHEAFLEALQQYGKEWKKVAARVKTRTVVQTRTHAQKYFQKLQKGLIGDKGDFEVDNIAEAKKILPIASARKGRSGTKLLEGSQEGKKQQQTRSSSTATPSASGGKLVTATQAVAELMTQLRGKISDKDEKSSSSISVNSNHRVAPISKPAPVSMKITAPRPGQIIKRNMFPEPSPAACGKRKAAEIAVAQMLAGVATTNDRMDITRQSTPPPEKEFRHQTDIAEQKHIVSANAGNLQIINPDTLLSCDQSKRARGHEPVTPWDTQLEALDK
jgi:myb-like DNA-binding domain, SHAQKYF class